MSLRLAGFLLATTAVAQSETESPDVASASDQRPPSLLLPLIKAGLKRVEQELRGSGDLSALEVEIGTNPLRAFSQLIGEVDRSSEDCEPADAEDPLGSVVAVGGGGRYWCSGVVIAPRLVLTARHCLPAKQVTSASNVEGRLAPIEVLEGVPHDDRSIDAALLILRTPAPKSLPLRQQSSPPPGPLRIVGYGAVDRHGREGFGRRHFFDLPATGWGCAGAAAKLSGCRAGTEVALLYNGGRDTCRGDSGGPVLSLNRVGGQCRWEVAALTLRAAANARVACGEGGVYLPVVAEMRTEFPNEAKR